MRLFLLLAGSICLLYFISVAFFIGHGTNFYFIWLFLGGGAVLFSLLMQRGFWEAHVPCLLRRIFLLFVCIGGVVFVIVEGCVISGFFEKGKGGLDYLIVLGAQMKESGPSKALQYRLDAAYAYALENPDTVLIVSGGQGKDEPVSEAEGMYEYLVGRGLEESRILKEDRSKNTHQNLTFSAAYLDPERDSVGIVSNNFHIFRAMRLAKKAGYRQVWGIPAKSEAFLQPNNMLREFFGVVKDTVFGNM